MDLSAYPFLRASCGINVYGVYRIGESEKRKKLHLFWGYNTELRDICGTMKYILCKSKFCVMVCFIRIKNQG